MVQVGQQLVKSFPVKLVLNDVVADTLLVLANPVEPLVILLFLGKRVVKVDLAVLFRLQGQEVLLHAKIVSIQFANVFF